MNAPLQALDGSSTRSSVKGGAAKAGAADVAPLAATMRVLGRDVRAAARVLALAPTAQKNRALAAMA
ncbi:MAG: hypothetical protein WBX95_20670, partial [Xanthobacteraceae bacterium]